MTLEKSMHNCDELLALKRDAGRVKRQTERLSEINPARKESYAEQLKGCLFIINGPAETKERK